MSLLIKAGNTQFAGVSSGISSALQRPPAPTAPTALNPLEIFGASLIQWLDGDEGVTLGGINGRATLWEDQGTMGNDMEQVDDPELSPVYPSALLDGHAGLGFALSDGTYMFNTSLAGMAAGDRPRIFVVGNMDGPKGTLVETGVGGSDEGQIIDSGPSFPGAVAARSLLQTSIFASASAGNGFADGTDRLYENWITPAFETEILIDGVSISTSATAATGGLENSPTTMRLGTKIGGPLWSMTGSIYAVVIVPDPSPADLTLLDLYWLDRFPSLALVGR